MFIFVHSMNLVNVMRPLMAPRLSLQLYPSFTIIFGTNHGLLGQINACPTFVPILSPVPKMFQKCSKIPDSSTPAISTLQKSSVNSLPERCLSSLKLVSTKKIYLSNINKSTYSMLQWNCRIRLILCLH